MPMKRKPVEPTWCNVSLDHRVSCGCVLYNDGVVTQCTLHAAAPRMLAHAERTASRLDDLPRLLHGLKLEVIGRIVQEQIDEARAILRDVEGESNG